MEMTESSDKAGGWIPTSGSTDEEDHTTLSSSSSHSFAISETDSTKIPLIFHPSYTISLYGMERFLNAYDGKKASKIFSVLSQSFQFDREHCYEPKPIDEKELLRVHTKDYLDSLSNTQVLAKITDMSWLTMLSQNTLRDQILLPMRFATGGTVLAAHVALKHGWAINLSGGYHHAKTQKGECFSIYADIPLAVRSLLQQSNNETSRVKKILIIDLDSQQGNGLQTIYALYDEYCTDDVNSTKWVYTDDDRIHIFDMYNSDIYPQDHFAKQFVTYDLPIPSYTEDEDYLMTLEHNLVPSIRASSPEIVIYNAGTSGYCKDKQGQLSLTAEGIIQRDEMVFRACRSRNIPIVMLTSGGYTMDSAKIVSDSICNLHHKGLISLTIPSPK